MPPPGPAPDRLSPPRLTPPRLVVAHCPDWPVAAADLAATDPDAPMAVMAANRVVAAALSARAEGVSPGLRRREAQARCPPLALVPADPAQEARAFEDVLRAIERFTPLVELTEPGTATFGARGPSRYHGGDEAFAALVAEAVTSVLAGRVRATGPPGVGVADGRFAATLAARAAAAQALRGEPGWLVVPDGGTATFLAPFPVMALADVGLVDRDLAGVFHRLGLRTLAQLAALPAADVVGRFGSDGFRAHQAAAGLDDRPPGTSAPPPELTVHLPFEPAVLQSGPVVFAAKHLADDLQAEVARRGMVITTCLVRVETEHGERHERTWHHAQGFTAAALAERVRWQLEGWAESPAGPTGGIAALRLVPVEVVADEGRQLGFWGGDRWQAERAARVAARLTGLLGPEAVTVPEWRGGRGPAEGVVAVAAAAVELLERAERVGPHSTAGPWPGRLPPPSPARAPASLAPATVVDESGRSVVVSGRGAISAAPALVAVGSGMPQRVTAWAGPWPLEERWWDPSSRRRRARFQVVTEDGRAHLVVLAGGRWWVAATYD
jgi:protein ImuB